MPNAATTTEVVYIKTKTFWYSFARSGPGTPVQSLLDKPGAMCYRRRQFKE